MLVTAVILKEKRDKMDTKTDAKVTRSSTQMLVINGLFIALTLVATMFINIRLPIMGNGGLIHLGNVPLFPGRIHISESARELSPELSVWDCLT